MTAQTVHVSVNRSVYADTQYSITRTPVHIYPFLVYIVIKTLGIIAVEPYYFNSKHGLCSTLQTLWLWLSDYYYLTALQIMCDATLCWHINLAIYHMWVLTSFFFNLTFLLLISTMRLHYRHRLVVTFCLFNWSPNIFLVLSAEATTSCQ